MKRRTVFVLVVLLGMANIVSAEMVQGINMDFVTIGNTADSTGYGVQWVALHKILYHSDPFPANGLTGYPGNPLLSENGEKNLRRWRQGVLRLPSRFAGSYVPHKLNIEQFYYDYPRAKVKDDKEAFVCYMLHRQLGDKEFFDLVKTYVTLRHKSRQPVSTSHFQKLAEDVYGAPLGWFFNQWVNSMEWPQLKLETAAVRKDKEGWLVQGYLLQLSDTAFRLPIELSIDTKRGREKQKFWIETKSTDFEFRTQNEPQRLVVDPNYEVLKIQKMAPRLSWFWNVHPEYIIIYGTLAEAKANKTAAERFRNNYLGSEIIKADTDVNEADLKTKCVFLFGRPETNKIAQQFKDVFPVKFDGGKFTWQETTYDQPMQGVAQIIENPNNAKGLMIMYAGLSLEATLKFYDLNLYGTDASFVIFDTDKELLRGDWEDADSNLYWNFSTQPSAQLTSNQR
jgi:hypothetical protein